MISRYELGTAYEQDIMTPTEITARREHHESKRSKINLGKLIRNGGLAVLAGLAFAHFTYDDGPDCVGSQRVAVTNGDQIGALLHEHISVPDGNYVDLRAVDYSVDRPIRSAEGNIYANGVQNLGHTAAIKPGDQVNMPKSCS